MIKFVRIIAIIYLFLLMPTAQAATQMLPLSVLGYTDDLIVKGANTQTSIFFPLPKANIWAGSSINLSLEPSPYLNNSCTFSVSLNEKPALNITAGQLRQNPHIKLPLTPGFPATKGVTVSIRTAMFAGDKNLCADYRRGYLFYTLKNSSNLLINLTPPTPNSIPDFFAGLYQGLAVVLPQSPTKEEINAAIWLYGALQKSYPYQEIKLLIGTPQGLPPNLPELWVAERTHLPPNLQGLMENLFLPFPNKLVVTANSGTELLQAARQLVTLPVYAALPFLQSAITSSSQDNAAQPERIYFGNNSAQDGITSISMDFPLYPGQLAAVPKSLGIHLEGRYSPSAIAGQPAKLGVYLNRSLIHSMVLDDTGILNRDINLPEGFNLKAHNQLSVTISYPEDENTCAVFGAAEKAQILTSSYYVGLRSMNREKLSWDNVGMLFGRTGMLLLEDNPSPEVIKAAAQMVNFLNSQLPPDKFAFPAVGFVSEYKKPLTVDYLVALSSADLPEELTKGLPIQMGQSSTIYQSNGQTSQITYHAGSDAVMGQLGNYQGIPLLAFQGIQSPKKLSNAVYSLTKAFNTDTISGNLYVYDDKPTFFSTLPPGSTEKEGLLHYFSIPWNVWEQVYRYAGDYYKFIFMSIIVIVSLVTFRWLLQRRKGKQ
ncbi:MAG: cellulose biosynthesis cyclic di-GMP-binding regulatory protein BcsB [Pelosinus sp.]|nr:cellulose biosynthesis cyclic di-GMP-binding regulatory protein BcsB [Pelosinus sp.]